MNDGRSFIDISARVDVVVKKANEKIQETREKRRKKYGAPEIFAQRFGELYFEVFGRAYTALSGKERGQIRNFVKKLETDSIRIMEYMVRNWSWLKKRLKIDGDLTLGIIVGYGSGLRSDTEAFFGKKEEKPVEKSGFA